MKGRIGCDCISSIHFLFFFISKTSDKCLITLDDEFDNHALPRFQRSDKPGKVYFFYRLRRVFVSELMKLFRSGKKFNQ